ncbi:MAG: hypothetical protein HYY03_08800 [Chloroflexi bacterium]|nr:hypothetical protein [Chloroflexota bacterium]
MAGAAGQPRREDIGDLIVLHLYGSYREMGRQHVELLGPLAREVYEAQRADWSRLIAGLGAVGRIADTVLPAFWMSLWRRYEGSRLYDEILGIAGALGVSGVNAWRGAFGVLGSGTTTFLATRAATADGSAIFAKNSDWRDGYGLRRPVVIHYDPDNGDLAHVIATWPLVTLPVIGVNEAGFALGANFFMADQVLGYGPTTWPRRRALQTVQSVEQGARAFTQARNRGLSGFVSMADAGGDIALVECSPRRCAVFRPEDDWFAQSNHARTAEMIPHDRGGSLDSERRRAAMEDAVRRHLGEITPEVAAGILRDRSNSPYVNESVVANTGVLNSTVVHPASRTLWHSTSKQPQAPFGEMIPFTPGDAAPTAPPIPADPRLGGGEMEHEARVIAEVRRAVRLFDGGKAEEAGAIWDRFADRGEPVLEPSRLTWARARVRFTLGRWQEADSLLARLDADAIPFDVRAHALVARAWIADRSGRRSEAVALHRRALAYLDANPRYNHQFTVAPLRGWVAAGLKAPQTNAPLPATPPLQRVP